jgi:Na+/proline symporter
MNTSTRRRRMLIIAVVLGVGIFRAAPINGYVVLDALYAEPPEIGRLARLVARERQAADQQKSITVIVVRAIQAACIVVGIVPVIFGIRGFTKKGIRLSAESMLHDRSARVAGALLIVLGIAIIIVAVAAIPLLFLPTPVELEQLRQEHALNLGTRP